MGMQGVGAEDGVLICESVQSGVEMPSWCRVKEAWRWGLDVFDMIRGKTQYIEMVDREELDAD